MLKRSITFEDFNGDEQTEIHYFNLTESELVELEVGYSGGLENNITAIVEAKDGATLLREFKKIILMAYGKKSEDGRRFIKTEEIREEFSQTAAYDALFMELATDDGKAIEFLTGIIPKKLQEQASSDDVKAKVAEKLGTSEQVKSTAELSREIS